MILSRFKNTSATISPSALWILVRTGTRPWAEFVRPANFTKPTDGSSLVAFQRMVTDRLLVNGMHFRYNYAMVSSVLMLYSLYVYFIIAHLYVLHFKYNFDILPTASPHRCYSSLLLPVAMAKCTFEITPHRWLLQYSVDH